MSLAEKIVWPLVFFFIGSVFALAAPPRPGQSLAVFFGENVITALSVGLLALGAGRALYVYLLESQALNIRRLVYFFGACILGGILGRGLSLLLHNLLQGRIIVFNSELVLSSLATIMITAGLSMIALYKWRRDFAMPSAQWDHMKAQSPEAAPARETAGAAPSVDAVQTTWSAQSAQAFAFKEAGKVAVLPYEKILYCTADAKKTLIHTLNGHRTCPEMLGSISGRLPPNFVRIHRKHIINIDYLTGMEHIMGGNYQAYLLDDEEIALPVGRSFVKELNRRLGRT